MVGHTPQKSRLIFYALLKGELSLQSVILIFSFLLIYSALEAARVSPRLQRELVLLDNSCIHFTDFLTFE